MSKKPDSNFERPIDYSADFDGPLKNRSCTDIVCLFLFVAFILAWVAIGVWAIKTGDSKKLLVPRDSFGLRCGVDEEVKNKPYLFFFDLTKCLDPSTPFLGCQTNQVCVEACPNTTFYKGNGQSGTKEVLQYCNYGTNTYDTINCPTWFLPSEPFLKRCIPNITLDEQINEVAKAIDQSNLIKDLRNAISNIKFLSQIEQVADKVIDDIKNSWRSILVSVLLALAACIIYIMLLRWIAGIMTWFSIAGVIAALAAGTYFSYRAWQMYKSEFETNGETASKTKQDTFLGIFVAVAIILAITLLIIIFLRKRIVLAIALIEEGSKAVSSVTSVLFFPVVPWIVQLGVIAYAVVVGVLLATTGEPVYKYRNLAEQCRQESGLTVNTICNVSTYQTEINRYPSCSAATCKFSGIANEAFYPYLQATNIFGFFWLVFFASALGQMVMAQVFAQWYWTKPKRALPFFALTAAFYRTIRYHLGTLAFGSLIIAICRMVRVALEYLDRKLKKYDNQFTKAIMCCLKCFFWCLEKFLKFINKNAYIMCAIHGKNFCTSAKDAFMLLLRNVIRVFVLDKVTDFLFFLSKLLVTAGVGAVAYVYYLNKTNSQLHYIYSPVVLIMIIAYLVSTLFFNVCSMAVDTLFLCFLEDCERNDGKTRPYYMSRNLMKIFGKKNKIE